MAKANLEEARLFAANLKGARLVWAKLKGAILHAEILEEFYEAEFDETTLLPDQSNWTPHTDMNRFTDPDHSNFWCSDSLDLPAYRGDDDNDDNNDD